MPIGSCIYFEKLFKEKLKTIIKLSVKSCLIELFLKTKILLVTNFILVEDVFEPDFLQY